jgi:hypothetical protein
VTGDATTGSAAGASAPQPPSLALGVGCLLLFLFPFAIGGLVTAVLAVRQMAAGDWSSKTGLYAVFALTFGGVGLGGMATVVSRIGKARDLLQRERLNPDAPWLWRPDWATGRIEDSNRKAVWGSWAFTALWNLISLPGVVAGVRQATSGGNRAGFLALLFPMVGVILAFRSVRATIRYRKFGVSRLELSTLPAVIGHSLAGTIRAPLSMQPAEGFLFTLQCVRRVTTRSGEDSSTSETVLWQEERQARGEPSRDAGGRATMIPVSIPLPPDAAPTDQRNSRNEVVWRLTLSASVPGIDYRSVFQVPVFRTPESDSPRPADEAAIAEAGAGEEKYRQPAGSRIAVSANRRGTEILFPAARNPGAATSLSMFTLLWWGTIWALVHFHIPLIFPIVAGLFGVLMVIGSLDLWLRVTRVRVDGSGIAIASGYLTAGEERVIPAAEIGEVKARVGMQSGMTPYYDIVVVRSNGRRVLAGRSVRDKREAEWLASTLKQALGR